MLPHTEKTSQCEETSASFFPKVDLSYLAISSIDRSNKISFVDIPKTTSLTRKVTGFGKSLILCADTVKQKCTSVVLSKII